MSPYTDHTKPLPEYKDIFLPEYKDVEKTLYPSGAFDEDDTPLRIGDKPSGIRGRWEKLSGVKKALGVILAIWAMMALIAIGRGKGRFEWDGEGGLDRVGFGELDSYVFTELAYDPDTYFTANTDGDGSTHTANASFTFGLDRMLDLTLPEDVEGEIIISYADDNMVYDDARGAIVIETTWAEGEDENPEVGVWSDDSSVTLAISSTGSHLIYLIIPQGYPVPSLNTNLPIRHNTLDLTYTSLSLTSESRNITGTYNVTGSIDFRTETGDIDVDVHVSSPPSPERRHRGGGPKGRLEEEEDESTEEGRWYWPFKAKGEGEGDNRVQDRYVSGGNPDGVNDGASAGEMVDSLDHHEGEPKQPGGPGRPNDSPNRKHRRPVPDPAPPGKGHSSPDPGPRRPPSPPNHPPGPAPLPHHSHGPPPPSRHPHGPPPPSPHHPPGPPHRGPHGPPPPPGSPPAVIRAHSMTGSITLRIHSDPVDIIDTDMKKHRGDKHRRDNHTRPVDIEAYTSTGSVSVTDKSFFGLFEAGTIEGKLEVKTDTEKGKGIEVIRRKAGEKGGRVEGFVKCANGTKVDEDEVVVDIEKSLDSPRHDPKELSRPPHSSPPRHDHPNHPPPPHGPPPPPHGPHGPPHGPPGPHRPDGPPPPPPGLSRVSAHIVVGDVQLNL